jgi:hypothetical protein
VNVCPTTPCTRRAKTRARDGRRWARKHRMHMTRYLLALMVVLSGCQAGPEPDRRIDSAAEAIKLAEQFVRAQGYTDKAVNLANFEYELLSNEDPRPKAEIWAERANTLEPEAYAYLRDPVPGQYQWWVYFADLRDQAAGCVKFFGVVMLADPSDPSGSGSFLKMHDIRQSLQDDAIVVADRKRVHCRSPNKTIEPTR